MSGNGFVGKHIGSFITTIAVMSIGGLIAWGSILTKVSTLEKANNPEEMGKLKEKVSKLESEHDPEAFGDLKTSIAVLVQALGNNSQDVLKLETAVLEMNATLIKLELEIKYLKDKHN